MLKNLEQPKRTEYFGIKLEKALCDDVKARAKKEGVAVSVVVRMALRMFMDKHKGQR